MGIKALRDHFDAIDGRLDSIIGKLEKVNSSADDINKTVSKNQPIPLTDIPSPFFGSPLDITRQRSFGRVSGSSSAGVNSDFIPGGPRATTSNLIPGTLNPMLSTFNLFMRNLTGSDTIRGRGPSSVSSGGSTSVNDGVQRWDARRMAEWRRNNPQTVIPPWMNRLLENNIVGTAGINRSVGDGKVISSAVVQSGANIVRAITNLEGAIKANTTEVRRRGL